MALLLHAFIITTTLGQVGGTRSAVMFSSSSGMRTLVSQASVQRLTAIPHDPEFVMAVVRQSTLISQVFVISLNSLVTWHKVIGVILQASFFYDSESLKTRDFFAYDFYSTNTTSAEMVESRHRLLQQMLKLLILHLLSNETKRDCGPKALFCQQANLGSFALVPFPPNTSQLTQNNVFFLAFLSAKYSQTFSSSSYRTWFPLPSQSSCSKYHPGCSTFFLNFDVQNWKQTSIYV